MAQQAERVAKTKEEESNLGEKDKDILRRDKTMNKLDELLMKESTFDGIFIIPKLIDVSLPEFREQSAGVWSSYVLAHPDR